MSTPFDHRQMRRAFSRSASSYDAAAALQHEVEKRLLESLDYLGERTPQVVLDVGSGPAHARRGDAQALAARAGARAGPGPADAARSEEARRLVEALRPRVRRCARAAVRRQQRRRAVHQPVPAMGRRPAGGVRRFPPRAQAGRPAAVFDLRPGHADRTARCLRPGRRRAACQPLPADRPVRRCADDGRLPRSGAGPRPLHPDLRRPAGADARTARDGRDQCLAVAKAHADRAFALCRGQRGLRRFPSRRRQAAQHLGSDLCPCLGAAAGRADPRGRREEIAAVPLSAIPIRRRAS